MKDKKLWIYIIALIVIVALAIVLSIINNSLAPTEDALKFKEEYEALNSTSVVVNIDKNNPIKYVTFEEVETLLTSGTGVIYFGFPSCPWCRNMIPVLFDVAKENSYDNIYYFNPRDIRSSDNSDYNRLIEILGDYLLETEGNKVLYVPDVYFIKDGNIVGHHLSTVESQTDPKVSLNTTQVKELSSIYQELFDKMK